MCSEGNELVNGMCMPVKPGPKICPPGWFLKEGRCVENPKEFAVAENMNGDVFYQQSWFIVLIVFVLLVGLGIVGFRLNLFGEKFNT